MMHFSLSFILAALFLSTCICVACALLLVLVLCSLVVVAVILVCFLCFLISLLLLCCLRYNYYTKQSRVVSLTVDAAAGLKGGSGWLHCCPLLLLPSIPSSSLVFFIFVFVRLFLTVRVRELDWPGFHVYAWKKQEAKKRGKINIADQEMVWVVVALNSSRDHKTQNPTREKRSLCCATGQFSAIISHFLHLKSLLGGALTPTPTPKRWPANVHPEGSLSVSCCFSSNSAEKCVHTRREKKKKKEKPREHVIPLVRAARHEVIEFSI